jgi:hypothetical protein
VKEAIIICITIDTFLNIQLALKRAVKKHDEWFHEEIHPSSSSGCKNIRATTQWYAVMTNCFQ